MEIFVPRLNEVEEGGYLNYPQSVRTMVFITHIAQSKPSRDREPLELHIRIFKTHMISQSPLSFSW